MNFVFPQKLFSEMESSLTVFIKPNNTSTPFESQRVN